MDLNCLLLCCGAVLCSILPLATADSVVVVSKRFTNNSYTCFVRHTKDGLEYHLTYNVYYSEVAPINGTGGIQCLYYECSLASDELLDTNGRLRCFRYGYAPPSVHQPLFDRAAAFHREWPIARHDAPERSQRRSRTKRDFSWVSFLEKFSLMGRHQSTVTKQNEAYFHYNFPNSKPNSGADGGGGGSRPIAAPSGPPAPPPQAAPAAPPAAPLASEP
uniref:Uncharacterized protein n=1 Tax=Anopheles atroparvus TaxID=41427 RepID=A0AAG5DPL5_ANOAO